jgi:hypothetical protein
MQRVLQVPRVRPRHLLARCIPHLFRLTTLCCSRLAESGNEIIICDGCDVCVHQVCALSPDIQWMHALMQICSFHMLYTVYIVLNACQH